MNEFELLCEEITNRKATIRFFLNKKNYVNWCIACEVYHRENFKPFFMIDKYALGPEQNRAYKWCIEKATREHKLCHEYIRFGPHDKTSDAFLDLLREKHNVPGMPKKELYKKIYNDSIMSKVDSMMNKTLKE